MYLLLLLLVNLSECTIAKFTYWIFVQPFKNKLSSYVSNKHSFFKVTLYVKVTIALLIIGVSQLKTSFLRFLFKWEWNCSATELKILEKLIN